MIVHNVIQGTEEWMKLRVGIPTASVFDQIVTTKGEPSKSRIKLLYKLAGEQLTGCKAESFSNNHIQRGIELESQARSVYSMMRECEVQEVGFCLDDSGRWGCSPDGMVGEGIVEIKCPSLPVHVEYLLKGKLPADYFQQVHGQMMVTGAKWCDFFSFYPEIKPLMVQVEPDLKFIDKLRSGLVAFCQELDETVKRLQEA